MKRTIALLIVVVALLCSVFSSCNSPSPSSGNISLDNIPEFSGEPYVVINGNVPSFTDEEKSSKKSYEFYSELDELGRCGYTMACIGSDLMPTEDRGSIGQVKPSGWQTVRYDIVDAKYLYNRCHLIGFQLTGENANVKNLITGTRYLNIEGMLPFENMVADYLKENPKNHVLYRCTPIFEKYNLVASGVHMEGYSIEDGGEGISFNVYAYNAQPGIVIDYSNGMSRLATEDEWNGKLPSDSEAVTPEKPTEIDTFILNTESKKIHTDECRYSSNLTTECKGSELGIYKANGYTLCGVCDPMPDDIWEQIIPACLTCKDKDDNGRCDLCDTDFSDGCDAEHKDADDDGKCDFGKEDFNDGCDMTDCRDANDDGNCDGCGFDYSDSCDAEHKDVDDDKKCDFGKEDFNDGCDLTDCRDANDDGKCDGCGFDFSDGCDAEHNDSDDDGKCDFGGEDFDDGEESYALNTSTKKIHLISCTHASSLNETCYASDFAYYKANGYTLCGTCKPITQEKWDSITLACEEHLDADDNEKCDNCGFDYSDGCDAEHKDADDDGKCDFGGEDFTNDEEIGTYVINTDTKKIHKSTCRHAKAPDGEKYVEFVGTESELREAYPEEDGYTACGTCKPFN